MLDVRPHRTTHPLRRSALALVAMGIGVAGGCGPSRPSRVPVSGEVLLDGKAVTYGVVRFVPQVGRASVGDLDEQGRFKLTCFEAGDGALLGKHRVEVIAAEALNETDVRWHAPQRYSSYETSGLEVEIAGPTPEVRIELSQSEKPPR